MQILMSEYRGQGGSEGDVEMCLGEVDDVLRLLACSRSLDEVDQARIAMMGWSHGGCVTLRALQRGADVRAAVVLHGVTDWVGVYELFAARAAEGLPPDLERIYVDTLTTLGEGAGGMPDRRPEAYARRSPLTFVQDLDHFGGDLLMVQGTEDIFVPVQQACTFAAAAGGFGAHYLDAGGAVIPGVPPGCEGHGLRFTPESSSAATGGTPRELVIYAGAGHGIRADTKVARRIAAVARRFLAQRLDRAQPASSLRGDR